MRTRFKFQAPDGSRMEMVADSVYEQMLGDLDAAAGGDAASIDKLCRTLVDYPRYAKALEMLYETETVKARRDALRKTLVEYEFMSLFELFGEEGKG